MSLRILLTSIGLLGVLATAAPAQSPSPPSLTWVLRGLEFSACVQFLMDPAAAGKQLGPGARYVRASDFAALSPVLRREIQGDTLRAGWVPAQFCFLEAPAMSVGSSALIPDKKMGDRELVGYWAIAASRPQGTPRQDQWYVVTWWANDWHAQRQNKTAFIPVSVFKRSLTAVPETDRHLYEVRMGKTFLSWEGVLVGRDSSMATESFESNLIFDGERAILWEATVTTRPQWTRPLPGIFRVEGTDALAKALKASPIRMFGPMYWGGDGRIAFSR